jgi:uncharacterized membrane protein
MKSFFEQNGIILEPLHIAMWGIPTAIAAFIIHGTRLYLLDRTIEQEVQAGALGNEQVKELKKHDYQS